MNSFGNDPLYYKSLKGYVYEILKFQINVGELSPGDLLSERKLASQFNVSRTPVREALQKLLRDDLIEHTIDNSLIVKTPSIDDIEEICSVYSCLVKLMTKHTINNITDEDLKYLDEISEQIKVLIAEDKIEEAADLNFDAILWDMSNMTDTIDYIRTLPQYWKHKCIRPYIDMERKKANILEHCHIVELLHEKDYDGFKALFDAHIKDNFDYTLDAYRAYFKSIGK